MMLSHLIYYLLSYLVYIVIYSAILMCINGNYLIYVCMVWQNLLLTSLVYN
uniref:Uncharacterized protein n=1 Tax=Octopus bimaculoides TaxID=37653 RepID=A0A0L8H4V9_OCTBM